jgi:arylsulfatase A-like enzyme
VQNIDFAPTFLEAAGVPIPADMQGKSMLALLRDGGVERERFRDAVYYRFEESKGPHTVPRHEGVATSKYKLIRFVDLLDPATSQATVELYDLELDADEMTNRAADPAFAEVRAQLLARLDALRAEYQLPAEAPTNSAVIAP